MGWWTVRVERTLSDDVPAPPETVRDFYVDLDNIRVVHPLIVSVERLDRHETADGYEQSYRVVDRIRLGPVAFKTAYRATLRVPVTGDVLTEAHQKPGVRLRGTVTFAPVDGGTRLTERLEITAPRPLAGITVREAVAAHTAMLTRIRDHFATS